MELLTGGLDKRVATRLDAMSAMEPIVEIHRADRSYRNRSLLLLGLTALLCVVLLLLLDGWLRGIQSQLGSSDPDTVRRWLRGLLTGLGIALAIPAALLGLGLRRLGLESRLQGRFPPGQWKTLRDVRVLRDRPALAWARRTQLAGTSALALAIVLLLWAGWVWWHFA